MPVMGNACELSEALADNDPIAANPNTRPMKVRAHDFIARAKIDFKILIDPPRKQMARKSAIPIGNELTHACAVKAKKCLSRG